MLGALPVEVASLLVLTGVVSALRAGGAEIVVLRDPETDTDGPLFLGGGIVARTTGSDMEASRRDESGKAE
jgi:hypothetical protein